MSRYARCLSWALVLCTTTLAVPVDAIVFPTNPQREGAAKMTPEKLRALVRKAEAIERQHQSARRPGTQELSVTEMKQLMGRGRNPYLCGTMPWHRSFRDVNLCTGNLFKSFTDIQIAPARGAGLVLQRTYNSNDPHIGPFGRGWAHAYDIRMEDADSIAANPPKLPNPDPTGDDIQIDRMNAVVRSDFFGGKHVYSRDADGLYTPPPYCHDVLESDYDCSTGPLTVTADTETSTDGTVKHFTKKGSARVCDYIKDRHDNYTELVYDTNNNLSMVVVRANPQISPDSNTDYSANDRVLEFTYTPNLGTMTSPIYLVTKVVFRLYGSLESPGSPLQTVTYGYYQPQDYSNVLPAEAGGEWYNLKSVTLSPGGSEADRTTIYKYSTISDGTETVCSLLSSITDPIGVGQSWPYDHTVLYHYSLNSGLVLVDAVTEPAGWDENGVKRTETWALHWNNYYDQRWCEIWDGTSDPGYQYHCRCFFDRFYRVSSVGDGTVCDGGPPMAALFDYDTSNNVTSTSKSIPGWDTLMPDWPDQLPADWIAGGERIDRYTYFHNGSVRSHWVQGFQGAGDSDTGYQYQDTYHYYGADKYYQKQSITDAAGHVTAFDYGTSSDATPSGDRGSLLCVTDARGKQFNYAYNQYGQKISERSPNVSVQNPDGVITEYTYGGVGDAWGNLTKVVQDPGSGSHLSRTTTMIYDAAGRVTDRTDPCLRASHVDYNDLGQPLRASFPATSGAPSETITYGYGDNGRIESVSVQQGSGSAQVTNMSYEEGCDRVASVTDPVTRTISYTYTPFGSVRTKTLADGTTWAYTYWWLGNDCWWDFYTAGLPTGGYPVPNQDDPNSYVEQPLQVLDGNGKVLCQASSHEAKWFNVRCDAQGNAVGYCDEYHVYDTTGHSDRGIFTTRGWLTEIGYRDYWRDADGDWHHKVLSRNHYTYDEVGNRTSNHRYGEDDADLGTETYQYDALSRLTHVSYVDSVQRTATEQTYTFDDVGNRLTLNDTASGSKTYTYDAANRLHQVNGADYATYDPNHPNDGNMLTCGARSNTWDSQDRLVQCTVSGTTTSFTYGADGLRHSMKVQTGTGSPVATDFAIEGQNVVQELKDANDDGSPYQKDSSGQLITNHGYVVPEVTPVNYCLGLRGIEYRDDSSGRKWYVYDGLGSVVAEVDGTNFNNDGSAVVTRNPDTDVYGNAFSGSPAKHGFVGGLGHVTDNATGLMYMRARYYDPTIGRFISEDPACSGRNWYAYCRNNPTNAVDPDGCVALGDVLVSTGTSMTLDGMDAGAAAAAFGACYLVVAYCVLNQAQIASVMDDCMMARKKDLREVDSVLNELEIKSKALREQIHHALREWKNKGGKVERELLKDIAQGLKQQTEGSPEENGGGESD